MRLAGSFRQAINPAAGQDIFNTCGKVNVVAHGHEYRFNPGARSQDSADNFSVVD